MRSKLIYNRVNIGGRFVAPGARVMIESHKGRRCGVLEDIGLTHLLVDGKWIDRKNVVKVVSRK